jgi:LDH2 family malate/lactate/ureidoglycolate dehydrogenase
LSSIVVWAVVDARKAMEVIAVDVAVVKAIATAETRDGAIAAVRNNCHCGALDHWTARH